MIPKGVVADSYQQVDGDAAAGLCAALEVTGTFGGKFTLGVLEYRSHGMVALTALTDKDFVTLAVSPAEISLTKVAPEGDALIESVCDRDGDVRIRHYTWSRSAGASKLPTDVVEAERPDELRQSLVAMTRKASDALRVALPNGPFIALNM